MYKKAKPSQTTARRNTSFEGETIEQKVRRIVNNKEPITDGAPLIFTNRKDGVQPEYDIRTDRFEIALGATDKIQKEKIAKRQERLDAQAKVVEMGKNKENKESNGD